MSMRMFVLAEIPLLIFWLPAPACCQMIRVIDDSATGNRWLLVKNAADPAGPGQMVPVERADAGSPAHPVIHAGDALVVEEHTAVVDARLEATALASAMAGSGFEARLKIGGKVVRVVALGPGRAELKPMAKAQR